MNNPQVAKHVKDLQDKEWGVRRYAAKVLSKIGDASAVPALILALKDEYTGVCWNAAKALGMIGIPAVPALIQALQDEERDVCWYAATALGKMGDSITLPRKILAACQFSAQKRIEVLAALRRVHKDAEGTLKYDIPETRALCQMVLDEEDAEARSGAQTVLNWLNGEHELVQASQRDTPREQQELLRAAQGGNAEVPLETLLRGAEEPERNAAQAPQCHTLRQRLRALRERLFGKRKDEAI